MQSHQARIGSHNFWFNIIKSFVHTGQAHLRRIVHNVPIQLQLKGSMILFMVCSMHTLVSHLRITLGVMNQALCTVEMCKNGQLTTVVPRPHTRSMVEAVNWSLSYLSFVPMVHFQVMWSYFQVLVSPKVSGRISQVVYGMLPGPHSVCWSLANIHMG